MVELGFARVILLFNNMLKHMAFGQRHHVSMSTCTRFATMSDLVASCHCPGLNNTGLRSLAYYRMNKALITITYHCIRVRSSSRPRRRLEKLCLHSREKVPRIGKTVSRNVLVTNSYPVRVYMVCTGKKGRNNWASVHAIPTLL